MIRIRERISMRGTIIEVLSSFDLTTTTCDDECVIRIRIRERINMRGTTLEV